MSLLPGDVFSLMLGSDALVCDHPTSGFTANVSLIITSRTSPLSLINGIWMGNVHAYVGHCQKSDSGRTWIAFLIS